MQFRSVIIGASILALAACTEVSTTETASVAAPAETPSGEPAGSSQQIRYSQNLLNRYGYSVDASQLSLDQHIRLGRIQTLGRTGSAIRFDIDAVLRRGA